MYKFNVKFTTIKAVQDFVAIASKFSCDIDLAAPNTRYTVDAKSIMGVFSLDSSQPLEVRVHTNNDDVLTKIKEEMKAFIV